MPNYNISINEELSRIIDHEMKRKKYANRSEFFRDLLRRVYINDEYTIAELSPKDPDMQLIRSRKAGASFARLKDLLA